MARTIRTASMAVPLPTVPTVEAWRAMTPDERIQFQVEVNTALTAAAELMSEGVPHKRAKSRTVDALGLHFKAIGRAIYLAEELSVLYPVSADLIRRLQGMVESLETKADEAQARAEQAQARAEQAEARADQAVAGLREALLALLDARGLPCPDDAHARIQACDEPATLRSWLTRAKTAGSTGDIFSEAPP